MSDKNDYVYNLSKRIEALEAGLAEAKAAATMVYFTGETVIALDALGNPYQSLEKHNFAVSEVLQKVLKHLGLKLHREAPVSAKLELRPLDKAGVTVRSAAK